MRLGISGIELRLLGVWGLICCLRALTDADTHVFLFIAYNRDAAHTVHPLAGQGLNIGLSDVSTLSSVIQEGIESGQDIGSIILLENYAKDRYAQNVLMSGVLHGIQRLFGTDLKVVSWLRSFGLNSVNGVSPLKVCAKGDTLLIV